MRECVMKQIRSFLYVGIVATGVDLALYSLLVYLNLCGYVAATIIGYSAGFGVSFFLTRGYVFSKVKIENIYCEFLAVYLITVIGLLLNLAIVFVLMRMDLNVYLVRCVAIAIVFFFNYFSRKRYVYS